MDEAPEFENTASKTETGGLGRIFYAGLFLGIGYILLFDSTTHLTSLYAGNVNSPIGLWIRVLVTSIFGSTCVLASLSVVIDRS